MRALPWGREEDRVTNETASKAAQAVLATKVDLAALKASCG
jgi:hypothetical protein